ncbi:phosphatidylserine/phosphatidylglycerophosphate/cardiolipin synthase family protein [Desulfopila sp. IMCC35008]|uniref:phospholipase D-like domain-containing protein n=1 Tax=Desulfopila sp. IMCC35008 TaxID=2653858 RepID=UPI0013D6E26D|nr:phospholipase D-like domain-containing protein [Desulfopila sp. IMCC35008]
MQFAEKYVTPLAGELSPSRKRFNVFNEYFFIRNGTIRFQARADIFNNVKVILKVYRNDGVCESFIVDTDYYDVQQFEHKRVTRDFFIHPFPMNLGQVTCVKFSYIIHLGEQSFNSQYDYIFMERSNFEDNRAQWREITGLWATGNTYRTTEVKPNILQRDVDHYNRNFESLNITPKFTRGLSHHPYHPKRFIHNKINGLLEEKQKRPEQEITIKVCVDCIDDTDFINHLIFAHNNDVKVQCIVDWRKMTLTNSDNYLRLKRSGIELLGVFCSSSDTLVEVAPDMHNKFIIFGSEDCILGSFNIAFDTWGANWESGATFHSAGVCRLLDNIFQSIRGGVIQQYGVDPLSHFNLLYTFGRHKMMNGNNFRPHQAIISKIHGARFSIKACLFLLGELQGDHGDSVIDALICAKNRGVELLFIFNGHMARVGDGGQESPMTEELQKPLLPAIARLKQAGVPIGLVYGINDHAVPYSPLHSKYCVIDGQIVLDGSFNWYNTSVFSHDHLLVFSNKQAARAYEYEIHEILHTMRVYWK